MSAGIVAGTLLMALGMFFTLATGVGMIRFRDVYVRLHLASKCLTAGCVSILLGAGFLRGFSWESPKVAMMLVGLLVGSPLAAHALARAAYRRGMRPAGMVRDDYAGHAE